MPGLVRAQSILVKMGINGLTCSACARSVEMQIRKLPFVKDVIMDIPGTEAAVLISQERGFVPDKLVRAVFKAGFSVRDFRVRLRSTDFRVLSEGQIEWAGSEYGILKGDLPTGRAEAEMKVIAKKFLPESERREVLVRYSIEKMSLKDRFILIQ
jgi:cation transport ATPase